MKYSVRISVGLLVLTVFFLFGLLLNNQTKLTYIRGQDRITLEAKTKELSDKLDMEHQAAEQDRQAQGQAINELMDQVKSLHATPVITNPASSERPTGQLRPTTTTTTTKPTVTTTSKPPTSSPPSNTTSTTTTTTTPCGVTVGAACVIH